GLLLARGPTVVEAAGEDARAQMDVATDLHVVEDGHAAEQGNVLEGARDPQLGPLVRFQMRDVAAVEHDPSAHGRIDAADAVEDARLAGAVGPDDGEEVAGVDLEAHPGQGGYAAEAQVQVFQSEQCHSRVTPEVPGE